jgi:hypothetical protein
MTVRRPQAPRCALPARIVPARHCAPTPASGGGGAAAPPHGVPAQSEARGHTNREIAQALFIAEGTAELHVSRILGKLGCATRAQAAAYAVAHGLAEAT